MLFSDMWTSSHTKCCSKAGPPCSLVLPLLLQVQQLEDRLAAEQAGSKARASDHAHQVGMLRQQLQGQQGQLERQAREVQQLQAALAAAQCDTQAEATGISARLATAQVRLGARTRIFCCPGSCTEQSHQTSMPTPGQPSDGACTGCAATPSGHWPQWACIGSCSAATLTPSGAGCCSVCVGL